MEKYIKVADLHDLLQQYNKEEISFSKIVEELNMIVHKKLHVGSTKAICFEYQKKSTEAKGSKTRLEYSLTNPLQS